MYQFVLTKIYGYIIVMLYINEKGEQNDKSFIHIELFIQLF